MKIKASRIENGVEICNTCVKPVNQPFRSSVRDGLYYKVDAGCVSKAHNGHIFDEWHNSDAAKRVRKANEIYEKSL